MGCNAVICECSPFRMDCLHRYYIHCIVTVVGFIVCICQTECIKHFAACFITGDYHSGHPGSVTTMLTNLKLNIL